jgi:hypothetical protein
MAKIKYLSCIFIFIATVSVASENKIENICRYESTIKTVDGNIVSTTEIKTCNEVVQLDKKSWWELFIQSPQYESTLIILLATLLN